MGPRACILEGMEKQHTLGGIMQNRLIKAVLTEDNMIAIGCGITFAALVIQFIIVSF